MTENDAANRPRDILNWVVCALKGSPWLALLAAANVPLTFVWRAKQITEWLGSRASLALGIISLCLIVVPVLLLLVRASRISRYNERVRANANRILREIRERGRSQILRSIKASEWHGKRVPYVSFQYLAHELRRMPLGRPVEKPRATVQTRFHVRNMDQVEDGLASEGIAILGSKDHVYEDHANEHGWAIWGPFVQLAEPGQYQVAFRIRCDVPEPNRNGTRPSIHFDVHWPKDPEDCSEKHVAAKKVITTFTGSYEVVNLVFQYRSELGVEFRVHPLYPGISDLSVDTISVVWLGPL